MGDYAVKIGVRNGRLLRAIRGAGYKSQSEFARQFSINQQQLNALVCMRIKARGPKRRWARLVWDIATALDCEPEDLFNEQHQDHALKINNVEVYMSEEQVRDAMFSEEKVWAKIEAQRLLAMIPKARSREIVIARMEGETLKEIGDRYGISPERVRCIEAHTLRLMKRKHAIAERNTGGAQ
jgi:transcriptional regulator with XRE-family HTH domain